MVRTSPASLCQSLLDRESAIDSVSQRIGSENGFERIGDYFLRLESFPHMRYTNPSQRRA
jgi:hypothetical protein